MIWNKEVHRDLKISMSQPVLIFLINKRIMKTFCEMVLNSMISNV
jgi:hypothetical protein